MSEMETEIEGRVESEASGSSVMRESTAVVGSVGGLRGTEKSVQLSGETATQEQRGHTKCWQAERPAVSRRRQQATSSMQQPYQWHQWQWRSELRLQHIQWRQRI